MPKRGPMPAHDQNEDTGELTEDRKSGPGNVAQTPNSTAEMPQNAQERLSSGVNVPKDTPYNEEGTRRENGMSSLDLVAGAGSAQAHVTEPARRECRIGVSVA
jgi:hypothetical protein